MSRLRSVAAIVTIAAVSFAGGAWWMRRPAGATTAARATAVYACPMHPQYRSDHPGDCPSCGMRLEPVREEGAAASGGSARPLPPGAVHVSSERQQAVGVRLGVTERVSGTRMLRTTGRVAPNENATYPIVAGVSGWIRNVRSATTGSQVHKDEILASFFAPEFVIAQQSYYTGLETIDHVTSQQLAIQRNNQIRVVEGVQRYADELRNLGVSEMQLLEMSKNRRLVQDIYITSPVNGFVLQRSVAPGLRFDRGFEFYRIADLSRVWILADVYQHQLPFIRPGVVARVTTPQVAEPFSAVVSAAEPIFDEATLTLKVRLETQNRGNVLKPGMFADVEFPINLPPALVVPADAIVDSGLRKTVFVDRGDGYFEPRQVETGWRIGDQVEVIRGVMPGERIVISGTFLIDSESRMKAASQSRVAAAVEDPVCGMQVDAQKAMAAGQVVEFGGSRYYFCAKECKENFAKNPARYVKGTTAASGSSTEKPPGAHPATAAPAALEKDPVCGMDVTPQEAVAAHLTSRRDHRTYYFCSELCKKKFDAEPARAVTP